MLFNSFEFIFLFLPLCLTVFFALGKNNNHQLALAWLVFCSLFFYGCWKPIYLILIVFSMLFNYGLGTILSGNNQSLRKYTLGFGITINVGLLAYFKYANFFVEQVQLVSDIDFNFEQVLLPLAISFFTFQQIAFLVDSYRHETKEYNFLQYCLFVTFFPQLIAGPIVHHKEVLPQFMNNSIYKINANHIAIGISIFAIGLFKKTVLADGIAPYSNLMFADVLTGQEPTLFVAWGGALAYTFQLYFDFSGYSDMAIGLARMFGIILPLNFYSPYKALNISEFWRRWHITLSNFLRDYVYIALGGNRSGTLIRYKNLFLTMFIGGLWHGAGWTFAFWGTLHGVYLISHQIWQQSTSHWSIPLPIWLKNFSAWLLTFTAVVIGWVFFRATNFDSALSILQGMFGFNGVSLPNAIMARLGPLQESLIDLGITSYLGGGSNFIFNWLWVAVLLPLVLVLPNTQDLFAKVQGSLAPRVYQHNATFWPLFKQINGIHWHQNTTWATIVAFALVIGLLTLSQVSEFLYFQF